MDVSEFQVTHLPLYPVLVAPSNLSSNRDWGQSVRYSETHGDGKLQSLHVCIQ